VFDIRQDDLEGQAVRDLLALHLAGMQAASPPEFSFALDLSGLKAPGGGFDHFASHLIETSSRRIQGWSWSGQKVLRRRICIG